MRKRRGARTPLILDLLPQRMKTSLKKRHRLNVLHPPPNVTRKIFSSIRLTLRLLRQVSPPRSREKRHQWQAPVPSLSVQPLGGADWAWLVKRLYKLCVDLCNSYIQMLRDLESTLEETVLLRGAAAAAGGGGGGDHVFFLHHFQSETSTPTSAGGLSVRGTPSEEGGYRTQTADVSAASPEDTPTPSPGFRSDSVASQNETFSC